MTDYWRIYLPGATWFFTVNLVERKGNQLLVDRIDVLRESFIRVRKKHPYHIDAIVILPDHLHCILTLPSGDKDFSMRWGLIKSNFSRGIENRREHFQKPCQAWRAGDMTKTFLGSSDSG